MACVKGNDAVERALDPDRLLPGEDPRSRNQEDAQHWVEVYGELRRFKRDLIDQTRSRMDAMDASAQGEVKDVDLAIMLEESHRLSRRLEYWQARLGELAPSRTR